jgi:hypothetical protein
VTLQEQRYLVRRMTGQRNPDPQPC